MNCSSPLTDVENEVLPSAIATEPEPEPIFAAISRFKAIDDEMIRHHAVPAALQRSDAFEAESSRLGYLRDEAQGKIYDTTPCTMSGLLALVRHFIDEDLPMITGIEGAGAEAVCNAVLDLVPESGTTKT